MTGYDGTEHETVVVARDLSVEYRPQGPSTGFVAIDGVDFTIGRGELIGIVGQSGSGKSTLAATIAGRVGKRRSDRQPVVCGGALEVLGRSVRYPRERDRRWVTANVGYLPQDAGRMLRPDWTIAENVSEPLFERDRHFDRREAGVRVAELIDAVQLPLGAMAKYPHELSNGQRQRAAIARSLILEPQIWVADEPTAGVDVMVRGPVLDTLLELQSDREFTAVIVSHDAAITARLTDRVMVLFHGVLVGMGPVEEVLARQDHPYIRGLAHTYRVRTEPIAIL